MSRSLHPGWVGRAAGGRRRNRWRFDHAEIVEADDVDRVGGLSEAQLDLLRRAAEGEVDSEVAMEYGVTVSAIKFQFSELYRALGMPAHAGKRARATYLYGRWVERNRG